MPGGGERQQGQGQDENITGIYLVATGFCDMQLRINFVEQCE